MVSSQWIGYNQQPLPLKSLSAMDTPMYFHNETREVHEMLATMELGIKVSDVFVDTICTYPYHMTKSTPIIKVTRVRLSKGRLLKFDIFLTK